MPAQDSVLSRGACTCSLLTPACLHGCLPAWRRKNSNTSQFYITLAAAPACDGKHVVIGRVVEGLEVLRRIGEGQGGGGIRGGAEAVPGGSGSRGWHGVGAEGDRHAQQPVSGERPRS